MKIITDKLKRFLCIPVHQMGIFTHNMNLLHLLLVVLFQLLVIFRFVLDSVVFFFSLNLTRVLGNQTTAFNPKCLDPAKIKNRLLHFFAGGGKAIETNPAFPVESIRHFLYRK